MTINGINNYWQKNFRVKITREYHEYKREMLMKTKREIYSLSYQIDYWICIYEKLIELSESLSTITLTVLYAIPDLINLIYQDWLKEEDYSDDELTQSVMKSIRKIRNNAERSA